jgi:hypothetical protein
MTGEDRFANIPAQLDELLERGEISLEAFALYTAMAEALSLTPDIGRCEESRFRPKRDRSAL